MVPVRMTRARFVSSAIIHPDFVMVGAEIMKSSYTPPNNTADRSRINLIVSQDLLDVLRCAYSPSGRRQSVHHGGRESTPIRRYTKIEQRLFTRFALDEKGPRGRIRHVLQTVNWRCHEIPCRKIFQYRGGVDDADACHLAIGDIEESGGRHGCFCFWASCCKRNRGTLLPGRGCQWVYSKIEYSFRQQTIY